MSSFKKTIAVLEVFNSEETKLTIEEIIEKLDLTAPTAYRYVRDLCDVGLLARFKGGYYTIGPKAIELDFLIRQSDVIINSGIPYMQELVKLTASDVLYGSLYNDSIILSHEEQPTELLPNRTIERGKKLHPIKGSTAKAILCNLPKEKARHFYNLHEEDAKVFDYAQNFESFWRYLLQLKKKGYVKSMGEIDKDKVSLSVPIFYENEIRGALTLGLQKERYELFDESKLVDLLRSTANTLMQMMNE